MTKRPIVRTINKGREPECLAVHRREAKRADKESGGTNTGDAWNLSEGCPESIREALCVEQGYLCAYCMQRIRPHGYRSNLHNKGGMKIEHWADRSSHPARMYDWDNLLGVCGGEYRGGGELVQHCDTSRGNRPLVVHPKTESPPRPERVFFFSASPPPTVDCPKGQRLWIRVAEDLPEGLANAIVGDLESLNLNADHLAKNRHSVLVELRHALSRCDDINKFLRQKWRAVTRPGVQDLPPFAGVIKDYVEKKMRSKGLL